MNDEELRAFLDSATVGGAEGDSDREADDQNAQAGEPWEGHPTEGAGAPGARKGVPSFDDLMKLPAPEAVAKPEAPDMAPTPHTVAKPAAPEWTQAYAKDDEQLVPLILPGFSPEPKQKPPLPPVFRPEPTPAASTPPVEPALPVEESAPTQPFDVIPAVPPVAAAQPVPAFPAAPVPDIAPPVPAAAPVRSTVSPMTAPLPEREDPFAILAPELLSGATEADDYEKISVVGSEPRGKKALPWVLVGAGAIIAIVASIVVINGVRGSDTPAPAETTAPATSAPTTTSPSPTTAPTTEPTTSPEPDAAPTVDPGDTYPLAITQWGLTVDRSNSFGGSTPYELQEGNTRAMFELPLAQSLPESCAAARTGWGLLKKDDATLEVIRPMPRCTDAAAAAVYDKIWGLMDYMAKSARAS